MIHFHLRFRQNNRILRRATTALSALVGVALLTGNLHATPIPANLGNGLGKLVESNVAVTSAQSFGAPLANAVQYNGATYVDQATANYAALAITDEQGRVLVRVHFNGRDTFKNTKRAMKTIASTLSITAIDKSYRGVGVLNAYVDVSEVAALAQVPGVSSVFLELKPYDKKTNLDQAMSAGGTNATVGEVMTKLGTDFDQGVTQHRVDQINQYYNPSATLDYEGQGMQIACISNSYDAHKQNNIGTAKKPVYVSTDASIDVANFDLPGDPKNPVNTTPVYVFLDDLSSATSDDEGRGMCQIVYKMAPKAAIAFGTANTGEVGFANVIRGLAGIAGYTNSGQTFAADTICDDVGYFDEPYFQDGIIAGGITDASAAGVAYFSSAGNDIGTNGYDSPLRFVANGTGLTSATNTALAGTNINLANVPAALYAGGFHNFNPSGLDVAQTVNDPSSNTSTPTVLQYNEPYNQSASPNNEALIYTVNGNYATTTDNAYTFTITPSLTAGTIYELDEIANGDGFDGAITITDPNGNVVVPRQDNAVDEVVRFTADVTGTGYTVTVGAFNQTMGAFTLNLYSTTGFSGNVVTTQISLLVFDSNGNYLPASSLVTDERATDTPIQLGLTAAPATGSDGTASASQVQFVFARSNVSTSPNAATEVRYVIPGNGVAGLGPAEYFTYTTVTTGGHAMSATCNGMAAMSVFRPSLPEYFSSPGPVTIYYDANNNRLATPEVRLQPHLAAADAGNVSSNMNGYFVSDANGDPDTNGNFSGTSAAGPHAAAIGALVLQAHGGRRSITPAQMTNLLERSTFPHDLDPNYSSGSARVTGGTAGAGKVTVTINSDNDSNATTGLNDNNAFTINYIGGSNVTSFAFNPGGTSATAGNVSGGNNGVTYNPISSTTPGGTATYFENDMPGAIFMTASKLFTVGSASTIPSTSVLATYGNPSSAVASQNYTMTLTLLDSSFTGGNVLRFGVGRGYARSSSTGSTGVVVSSVSGAPYYCADIFGGGVIIPEGTVVNSGMSFSGTTADGGKFSGVIKNNIGSGYSPLDGYGFINAQTAVSQSVQ